MNRVRAFCLAAGYLAAAPCSGFAQLQDSVIDVLHYRFHLILSDSSDVIRGHAELTVRFLAETSDSLSLDLVARGTGNGGMVVTKVTEDGLNVAFTHVGQRLSVALASRARLNEQHDFSVDYSGIPVDGLFIDTNMFGDRTFFGDNWPDRARHWLPTHDHPSDKATVDWIVEAPDHYDVVANGRVRERSRLEGGREITYWESTSPIPTKVMVIGVARFATRTTGFVDRVPIEAWVYPQNREAGFHDFALAEGAVRFFQDRIGTFPYEKLANVQSRTRYGGMENASAIFYTERAVRGDRMAEELIVHETAHQWFGDAVTEADWPDVWLSEGFATYLTHVYAENADGPEAMVAGMEADRREVIRFHSTEPEMAMVPVGIEDPNLMLNPNAYQKGAWLLHMLRRQMGEEAFWSGIRTFYQENRNGNASTDDFRRVMEEASGQDLAGFFQQWARRAGHPALEGAWHFDAGSGEVSVTIRQTQGGDGPFRFPLDLGMEAADGSFLRIETVQVTQTEQTFSFALDEPPEAVVLDPDTWLLFQGELSRR